MSAGPSLEEFKRRLPIAEIIGHYLRLIKRGREFQGLCPFHKEKTPSFNVVPDKGFYHCFGCGAHGTAIDFIMRVEGLEFGPALTRLADLTGIPAPVKDGAADRPKVDRSLYAAMDAATRWYQSQLRGAHGQAARAYIAKRGLAAASVERFALGYAPANNDGLKTALLGEGFAEASLVEAGLLVRPEDGRPSFDRFRHRLIFPIHDARGRVVAFGGRALGEAKAKYLNSPETPLFHKGEQLYNLQRARRATQQAGALLVAEGYMDVIALDQAGYGHAVAPLGTALTEAQIQLLWQSVDEPLLCLDGDTAGQRAALRAAERALPLLRPGKSLRVVLLPPGDDPDSLLKRTDGKGEFEALLAASQPLIEVLWQHATAGRALDTPERRAGLKQDLLGQAALIQHQDIQKHYRSAFYDKLSALFRPPARAGAAQGRNVALPLVAGVGAHRLKSSLAKLQRDPAIHLIIAVLQQPELLPRVEDEFLNLSVYEDTHQRLVDALLTWYRQQPEGQRLESVDLLAHLKTAGLAELLVEWRVTATRQPLEDAAFDEQLSVWRDAFARWQRSLARDANSALLQRHLADEQAEELELRVKEQDILLNS